MWPFTVAGILLNGWGLWLAPVALRAKGRERSLGPMPGDVHMARLRGLGRRLLRRPPEKRVTRAEGHATVSVHATARGYAQRMVDPSAPAHEQVEAMAHNLRTEMQHAQEASREEMRGNAERFGKEIAGLHELRHRDQRDAEITRKTIHTEVKGALPCRPRDLPPRNSRNLAPRRPAAPPVAVSCWCVAPPKRPALLRRTC